MQRTAEITVPLPRDAAMALFTAEGERGWAEGWEPRYPEPGRTEGPGAVFVTAHGGRETTWVMVDQTPERVRYARVTPGLAAGTVAVAVAGAAPRSTRVAVTYDLTPLSDAGEAWLAEFARDYDDDIASWERDIAASLQPTS